MPIKPFELKFGAAGSEGIDPHRLSLNGFFEAHAVADFEAIAEHILKSECQHVVLDLKDVKQISSAAIGSLMYFLQELRRHGGNMVMVQPAPQVTRVLEMIGFTELLAVAPNRSAALELISREPSGNS